MLQRLKRALPLIFLFANIIAAEDEISVEIEGLSNFFNPFNWFGEDESASEAPAPQPQPELVAQPNPAPNLASPSEPLGVEKVLDTNPESEVRIEGAPRDSIASLKPISTYEARQPDNVVHNNIARPSAGPSNNVPSNFGQPGRTLSYGGPPYGVPLPPHHLRRPGNEHSAYRALYMPSPYGNAPPGNSPYGNAPQGNSPYGNAPPGNSPYGNAPQGNSPYGNAPQGNSPYGNAPQGNLPNGNAPAGNSPYGNAPLGNLPYGNAPAGNSPYVNAPTGNSPYGNAPLGNLPYGNAPPGNSPYGNSPYGNAPQGNSPYGDSPYNNPAYRASNPFGRHLNTRNAPPLDSNPSNNRAAPPDPSSYRSRSNKRRGKLTLKPKEQPTTA